MSEVDGMPSEPAAGGNLLDANSVVLRLLLERNAIEAPLEPFIEFEDGESWTRGEALEQAYAAANELRRAGVRAGDVVAAALPNGAAYIRTLWGAATLGASITPVNPANKGRFIRHMLDAVRPNVIVAADEFRVRLSEIELPGQTVVLAPDEVRGSDRTAPILERPIQAWDPISMAMTSGTTGPPKIVKVAYAQSLNAGQAAWLAMGQLSATDVYLCDVPMVHVAGLYVMHSAVAQRSRIAVRARPNLESYWEVARDTGATWSQLYSTMVTYLEGRPQRSAEREHNLRMVLTLPMPPDPQAFKRRFGIDELVIGWGSTEIGMAVGPSKGVPLPAGSTGRVLPGWHVRLVDENDIEVPPGQPGEAIVRSDLPWLITSEYLNDPAGTAAAWRNGWFHTGDLLRIDDEGNVFYVDRVRDSLRRRGQNVSSFEVELVVQAFAGVAEAAAVAERSDVASEDEIKVWVTLDGSAEVDFAELLRHCSEQLPHYMVPRYFEIAKEFPKTPSAKIRKNALRDMGSGPDTWDRKENGLDVTRFGLVDRLPI
jgi:carnitine-CoA ligase